MAPALAGGLLTTAPPGKPVLLFFIVSLFRISLISVLMCTASFFLFLGFFLVCVGSSLLLVAFSKCSKRGLLFLAVLKLLIVVASLVAEHKL